MTTSDPERALSFGQAAEHYDAIRPTYPAEAIRWALGDSDRESASTGSIVDLGAGTGLLTRAIVAVTTAAVIPVEPDAGMRAQLTRATARITPLAGSAEAIPLPDASVDAVLVGQAYHWFDKERAHPEIARVLRPGGVFAPMWNIRDETVPWVAEYTRRVSDTRDGDPHEGGTAQIRQPRLGPDFAPVSLRRFRHAVEMNAESLVALLASRSYYLTATPERQADLRRDIAELAATLPEIFEMPYETYVYRTVRR